MGNIFDRYFADKSFDWKIGNGRVNVRITQIWSSRYGKRDVQKSMEKW
jgi:lambda repressor-like predicted transcriptional regulator